MKSFADSLLGRLCYGRDGRAENAMGVSGSSVERLEYLVVSGVRLGSSDRGPCRVGYSCAWLGVGRCRETLLAHIKIMEMNFGEACAWYTRRDKM